LDAIVQTAPLLSTICEVVVGTIAPSGDTLVGVYVTVTVKLQLAVWPSLDRAVTATDVAPTGNALPDAGFPVTVTGATPPAVVAL
jgi:hypothetical protein